ncbi:MAG: glycosyltransferase 87 family protein [Actinomycetia bacterium]|nr:glycosyltransferase 87 family protein [Actinomycetes bacterium]
MATTQLARSPRKRSPLARAADDWARLPAALRGPGGGAVALRWALSRAMTLCLLVLVESSAAGDPRYYAQNLTALSHGGGIGAALPEYPLPVLAIMVPQYAVGGLTYAAFPALFAASMLGVDAAFAALLWRRGGRRPSPALRLWLWFVPLMGPMAFFRFDLVPAALVGWAVLVAGRRPARAGALIAGGAALKLWPAVILPILALRRRGRGALLAGFAVAGAVIVAVCLAVGGTSRLYSPLRYQSARGLQIEAVLATPLMLWHAVHPGWPWLVAYGEYNSADLFGAGRAALATVASALMAAAVALTAWLWLRAARQPSGATIVWLALASALLLTVTNKVLSPQYLLWLGGPIAALLVISPADAAARRVARWLLITAAITQVMYPTLYNGLVYRQATTIPVTLVLVARNAALVWLTWLVCREAWRRTARGGVAR